MTPTATLSPLSASEADGVTFSLMSPHYGEMGVVTFSGVATAAAYAAKAMRKANVGIVPRNQRAVDALAEVL